MTQDAVVIDHQPAHPTAPPVITAPMTLTVAIKAAAGAGNMVETVSTAVIGAFLFFYYTAVLGLSGAMVGLATGLILLADAVADPLIGSLSDNLRSRWGRRVPFMLVGGPLVALSIGLLFSPPAGLPPMGLLAWLVTMTLVLRFAVSAFHVPYLALGAELSEDYAERSSIVAYRTIFYVVGPLLILGLAYGVFFAGPLSLRNPLGYPRVGWASAAIILVGAVVSVLGVRRFAAGLTVAAASTSPLHVRMAGELAEIFRNPSFRVLFGCSVLFWAAQGVAGSLNQYLNVFVWHINSSEIFLITMGFFVGVIVGVPLGPFLSRRFEKRIVSALGFGILLVAQGDLTGLRALGVFTATGAAATLPILINTLVAGVGVAFASIAIGSMMADAADEHDFLFGARREGLYFAGLGFAGKAATGIGSVVGGIAIDLIGFPKGAAASNVALHLPETMLTNLSIAGGPVVSLLSLAAVSLLMFYRIDRRRHAEIVEALRLRREAAA